MPLLAGAASITSVIVIMNELQGDLLNQTLIISALLTVMLITLAVFYILARTGKFINKNITNVILSYTIFDITDYRDDAIAHNEMNMEH